MNAKKLGSKSSLFGMVLAMVFAVFAVAMSTVYATDNAFEIEDADIENADDTIDPRDDWENVYNTFEGLPDPDNSLTSVFISSSEEGFPNDTTTFKGGGSKDVNDIGSWKGGGPAANDKTDIQDAFAALYTENGDAVLYFGLTRFAVDGDAAVGFWFLQDEVEFDSVSNDFGDSMHLNGDILIQSDYTQGGVVSTIRVYLWSDQDLDGDGKIGLELISTLDSDLGDNPVCVHPIPADQITCGISNSDTIDSIFPYLGKNQDPNTEQNLIPQSGFFEGRLNLTKLEEELQVNFGIPSFNFGCFARFLAETRTTQSPSGVLKDFALGEFDSCALSLKKTPDQAVICADSTDPQPIKYTYEVTNEGALPLVVTLVDDNGTSENPSDDFDVIACHNGVPPGDPANDPTNPVPAPVGVGETAIFMCTVDIFGQVTNVATAEGGISEETIGEVTAEAMATVLVEQCSIMVTKDCDDDNNGEIDGTKITYDGNVKNTGTTTLDDVMVIDDNATPDDDSDDVNLALHLGTPDGPVVTSLEPGQTAFYSGMYDVDLATYDAEAGSTNTVDASGIAFKGTSAEQEVTDTDDAKCFVRTKPDIVVDKNCDKIQLVQDPLCGNKLVLLVKFKGTVMNDGDVGLIDVTVVDDKAAQMDIQVTTEPDGGGTVLDHINGFDLPFGTTVHFSGSYVATSTDSGTDVPSEATFTDIITAQGKDAINENQSASDDDDAECPLCPTSP